MPLNILSKNPRVQTKNTTSCNENYNTTANLVKLFFDPNQCNIDMIYNDNFIFISLLAAKINQVLTKSTLMDYSQYITGW